MTDYIKREDALRAFNGSCSTVDADDILRHLHKGIDVIKNMPSADVVEVVRCKDCVYWDEHERCDFWSSIMSPQYPEKNDYCSYGERAEA